MIEEKKKINNERQGEINIFDLIIFLLKYKWMILSFILITITVFLVYINISGRRGEVKSLLSSSAPALYYSDCLIESDPHVRETINHLYLRRNFVLKVVEENNLLNDIQQAILNEKKQGETAGVQVSKQEVYRWLKKNLFVTPLGNPLGNILTIGFVSPKEDLSLKIVNAFLFSLSEYFRKPDLEILVQQRNKWQHYLAAAQDPFLKDRIAEEIIEVTDKETIAQSKKYYGFTLLDPPTIINKVKIKKIGSERKIEFLENGILPHSGTSKFIFLIFLLVLGSSVVAISLAFIIEYVHNIKMREPEKIAALKRYLYIRSK